LNDCIKPKRCAGVCKGSK